MSYNDIRTTEPPFPTPVSQDDYDALAARLASADIEATSLLMAMVQQWPDVHPDWKPLPDVAGKITQINNMVAGLRARLAEAEHLILRMAGEDYQRARFYVEKYDLTGERAAVSASDVPVEESAACEIERANRVYGRGAHTLMELMKAYERRVRSDCTSQADIDARPWECAEYRAAADYLRKTWPTAWRRSGTTR